MVLKVPGLAYLGAVVLSVVAFAEAFLQQVLSPFLQQALFPFLQQVFAHSFFTSFF